MNTQTKAAIYLLKYQGQRGTPKQIERLLKVAGPSVVAMAVARGFKVEAV